jgi:hypothetical protein
MQGADTAWRSLTPVLSHTSMETNRAAHDPRLLPVASERAIDHVCLSGPAHLRHRVVAARGNSCVEVEMSEVNLERALNDPADLFESPDAVVRHPTLTREQKIQILNNWQLDASRLEASEAEGMGGEDAPMLHRVRIALAALFPQQ